VSGQGVGGANAPTLTACVVPFRSPQHGAVVVLDESLRYVSVTEDAAALLDTTPDALIGRQCWDIYPTHEHTPVGALMRDVLQHRVAADIRAPVHDRPGQDAIVRCVPTPDGGIRALFRFVTRIELSQAATLAQTATGTSG
jgi:PAS domain-containing protein